jgi:DNA-binding CsgD family transcriptional regulator
LTNEDVSRLIERIYAAGETGEGWTECLETIAETLQATCANLLHFDLSAESGVAVAHTTIDPAAMDAYGAYFHRVDPWETRLPARAVTVGRVMTGLAVLSHADFRKTEYYADFARPFGVTRALFGVTGHNADGTGSAISIVRADRQAEFEDDAVRFLSILMPHLGRALQVHDRWAAARRRCEAAMDALDTLTFGVILVDGHGGVCHANARASALLARRDGIAMDDGRLRCAKAAATRRLRDVCAEIAASRSKVPRHAGGFLILPRISAPMPLHAVIAPVRSRGAFSMRGKDVVAILFITDPAEAAVPDAAFLRASYGLTSAEACVAALLAVGGGVEEVVDECGYTRETARWYVKRVVDKSGCKTRSQFVAQAAASIARLRLVGRRD